MLAARLACWAIEPQTFNFGDVPIGGETRQMFTVTNHGDLMIATPVLTLASDDSFVVAATTCDAPLAARASCTF